VLVLKRKARECIRIGDNVRICVTEVCGGHVKLGIEAPKDVPILREELIRYNEPEKNLKEN
jgi:carbon storage regulator